MRLRGTTWTVLLADDSRPTETRETAKIARRGSGQSLVFLTPTVLFEAEVADLPGDLAELRDPLLVRGEDTERRCRRGTGDGDVNEYREREPEEKEPRVLEVDERQTGTRPVGTHSSPRGRFSVSRQRTTTAKAASPA